jgi:hypothetical protein
MKGSFRPEANSHQGSFFEIGGDPDEMAMFKRHVPTFAPPRRETVALRRKKWQNEGYQLILKSRHL